MRKRGWLLITIAVAAVVYMMVRATYYFLSPMPFLLSLAAILSILYLALFLWSGWMLKDTGKAHLLVSASRWVSVLFLLILFSVSLKVVNDYQQPQEDNPYFVNADHYGIRNEAIVFKGSLTLYSDKQDTTAGIFASENGSLSILGRGDQVRLRLREFYTPVFSSSDDDGKEGTRLLNPQFSEPLASGFTVSDGRNTLVFTYAGPARRSLLARMKSWFSRSGDNSYDIDFIFQSRDQAVIGDSLAAIADSFSIKGVTLHKGLGILDLLMRDSDSVRLRNSLRLQRWLSRTSMEILTGGDVTAGRTLNLFLSEDAFEAGFRVSYNGRQLLPESSSDRPFDMSERFFVGLGKDRDSFSVARVDTAMSFVDAGFTHVLRPGHFAYRKLTDYTKGGRRLGTDEIRFLSNAPGDVGSFHLREGLLFHEATKDNAFTALRQGFLHYVNGPPGSPLQWKIWPKSENDEGDARSGRFVLPSQNGEIGWVYALRDFSQNTYAHSRMRMYMGILMGIILLSSIMFPAPLTREGGLTRTVLPIETPVWMIAYVLLSYRLLLLWRVATFPPVEGISRYEFNTLQFFDIRFQGYQLPLPGTVLLFAFFILVLWLYRSGYLGQCCTYLRIRLGRFVSYTGLSSSRLLERYDARHLLVVVGAAALKYAIPVEFLIRILELLVPVASHFYFTHKAIAANALKVPGPSRLDSGWGLPSFFRHWIDDGQEFIISLTTFAGLIAQDRGFAIIFIVFLILKNVFIRFSRKTGALSRSEGLLGALLKPSNHRVYGILALTSFVLFLTWKGMPDFLLDHRRAVAVTFLLSSAYCLRLYVPTRGFIRWIPLAPLCLAFLVILPWSWSWVDGILQGEIRHVKYRASLIHKPLSEVLRNEAYGSGAERKIIETAQNQWFIHTYLDHAEQFPSRIGFQPHFRTGVDYSTQTRDVVLPRYVIAEFGYLTMFGLIFLITLPLLAYLVFFQLNDSRRRADAESVTGLLALTFLFISALVVWMSSTNRFVFFGQDFPFLSLTSRLSVMLPLTVLFILLTRKPICRDNSKETVRRRLTVVSFFSLLIVTMMVTGGKTGLLRESHFQPRMDDIRDRIDEQVNMFFEEAQRKGGRVARTLSASMEDEHVGRALNAMYGNPAFRTLYDSLSRYERSMIDALVAKPATGFDNLRSPIHIIRTEGLYQLRFNNWFHMELPFYEVDKVWRGDLYQPVSRDGTMARKPPVEIALYVQQLPSGYFKPGEKPFAMIDLYNLKSVKSPEVLLYKVREKVLKTMDRGGFAERIDADDLLLFRTPVQGGKALSERFRTWNLSDGSRSYFGFNALVNGRRRMLYPMGSLFPWVREWANASKSFMEKRGGGWLDSSIALNLDYDLTSSSSKDLQRILKKPPTDSKGVLISVVAADGDGRIRLMADHAVRSRRIQVDPNNQTEMDDLQRKQYFKRSPEAERLQWGNANLLHMRDGPGSSIKPIVFAAVSSQRNLEWEKLTYIPHTGNLLRKNPNGQGFLVEEYAGLNLKREGLKWPEESQSNDQSNLEKYIAKSRNLHHSLIVFLGSYSRQDFPNRTLRDRLRPSSAKDAFPVVGIDNMPHALRPSSEWPLDPNSGRQFGNSNSLMAVGLSELFGLETQSSYSSGRLAEKTDFSMLPDSLAYRNVWAFPERSYFDQAERADNFSTAVIQTTLGGGVFRVTPVQMLQMYGRLFNQDQGFRLSIDSLTGRPKSWINLPPGDWSASSFDQFLEFGRGGNRGLLQAMHTVVESGTAPYLLRCKKPGYTIYAKTGTVGDAQFDYSSKRLFVAIVKDGIGGDLDEFRKKRKFFIYMTVERAYMGNKDNGWYKEVFANLINRIMESDSFKEYMQ